MFQFGLRALIVGMIGWSIFLSAVLWLGMSGACLFFMIAMILAAAIPDRYVRRSAWFVCGGCTVMTLGLAAGSELSPALVISSAFIVCTGLAGLVGNLSDRNLQLRRERLDSELRDGGREASRKESLYQARNQTGKKSGS